MSLKLLVKPLSQLNYWCSHVALRKRITSCPSPHYTLNTYSKHSRLSTISKMSAPPLVWIDCEMSGLNIKKDVLLEIAVIITDENLNIIAEGPDLIIQQPRQILDSMDEWCTEHHGKSGLTEAVLNSTISVEQAESQVLEFVKQHVATPKIAVLAGNSVHADKVFLARFMPKLIDHLHYRIVDVSTVKELARRWAPKVFSQAPRKAGSHRALEDIKESIAELQHYKSSFFNLEN